MNFLTAVKTCFVKYTDFKGRASRSEYWWFMLAYVLVGVICDLINSTLGSVQALVFLLPMISSAARRLHDIGKSGWFQLIPFYNLYLLVQPTQPESNAYGEPPTA